jgi:hypothetical protein
MKRLGLLTLLSLLSLALLRGSGPPVTASAPAAPGEEELVLHRPGVVYSTRSGRQAPAGALGFWLLTKSKKVWFRVDDVPYGQPFPHVFSYGGRPILHVGELPAWRPSPGGSRPVVWGDHVSGGWGRGPEGTNFYLSIWTRWSLQHLAFAHPERFELHYRPAPCRHGRVASV